MQRLSGDRDLIEPPDQILIDQLQSNEEKPTENQPWTIFGNNLQTQPLNSKW